MVVPGSRPECSKTRGLAGTFADADVLASPLFHDSAFVR